MRCVNTLHFRYPIFNDYDYNSNISKNICNDYDSSYFYNLNGIFVKASTTLIFWKILYIQSFFMEFMDKFYSRKNIKNWKHM